MNQQLSENTLAAIKQATDECLDGLFEYNYLPERVGELLEQRYGIGNIAVKEYWVDNDGLTKEEIVVETIEFCLSHKVKSYTVQFDNNNDIIYAVFLLIKEN